jgi:hypothetical protein
MLKNKFLVVILALFVSGCAHKEVIKYETVTVEVPIPIGCLTSIPERPDFIFNKITIESDIFEKVKALLADRNLSIAYQKELEAALASCK